MKIPLPRLPSIAKRYPIAFSGALILHAIFLVILFYYENNSTWEPPKIKPITQSTKGSAPLPQGVIVDFALIEQEKQKIIDQKKQKQRVLEKRQAELKRIEVQQKKAQQKQKQAQQKRKEAEKATKLARQKRSKEEAAIKVALIEKERAEQKRKKAEKAAKLAQQKRTKEEAKTKKALAEKKQAEAKSKKAEKAAKLAQQKRTKEEAKTKKALAEKKQAEAKSKKAEEAAKLAQQKRTKEEARAKKAEKAAKLAKQKRTKEEIRAKKAQEHKKQLETKIKQTEKVLGASVKRFKQAKLQHELSRDLAKEESDENRLLQENQLQDIKTNYIALIQTHIRKNWSSSPLFKKGWKCTVIAKQNQKGVVKAVNVISCNNNSEGFKRSVKSASHKSSPLPLAPIADVFDEIIQFEFINK